MRQAASYLVGEHDFIAFSSSGGQQKTTVRRIDRIDIESEWLQPDADWIGSGVKAAAETEGQSISNKEYPPKLIRITVSGNGFLYNMVRIIAGTLEKVGMGVYPPEYVKEILDSRDRRLSAPKAAARGLTLMEIRYL